MKESRLTRHYTRLTNRYYIGGAHVFEYLATRGDTTSTEFFHEAVTWQNRIPFLGLGNWLGVGAGQFPHQLGAAVQDELRDRYAEEMKQRRPFTGVSVVSSEAGLYHRRPSTRPATRPIPWCRASSWL